MAKDPKATMLICGFELDEGGGHFEIAAGTLEFLGIPAGSVATTEVTFELAQKQITKMLYPGGPALVYTRPQQTITRILGGRVSTAKSANYVRLIGQSGQNDTIRVMGSIRLFTKWLKESIGTMPGKDAVWLKSRKGTTLAVLRAPVGTPVGNT